MTYVPYKTGSQPWGNILNQKYGLPFYALQEGDGSPIQIVSPAEGSVFRAKLDLKRQLTENSDHFPESKRRRKTSGVSKLKKKKKPKTKKKKKKVVRRKKKKN